MRTLALASLLALAACSDSEPAISQDPTDSAAAVTGAGGSTSVSTTDAASSSDASTGVGGEGGAPSTTSSTTGAGGDGAGPSVPAGYQDGERLRAVTVQGTDGSVQQIAWWDTQREEACSFRAASDGSLRCLPVAAGFTGIYSDGACTLPVAVLTTPDCDPPEYLATYGAEASCPGGNPFTLSPLVGTRIHGVGALYEGLVFGRSSDGDCANVSAIPGWRYYLTTGEVAPSSFVAGSYAGHGG